MDLHKETLREPRQGYSAILTGVVLDKVRFKSWFIEYCEVTIKSLKPDLDA